MDCSTSYISTQHIESSIEKEYERDFSPISALIPGAPIEFLISGTSLFYISLKDSYFDIQLKILLADNGNIADTATVGPANLVAHTLFSNIELYLNGKQITEPTNHYHYRAYMQNLLNTSKIEQENKLIMEGWIIDTSSQLNVADAAAGDNQGLRARRAWFAESRSHRFIFKPRLDLFNQDGDIPPNTDIRIRLIPNRDNVILMYTGGTHFKILIQNIRFWARTHEVASNMLVTHQQQLHSGHCYRFGYPTISVKTLSVPTGTGRQEFDNLYLGPLPRRIIMVMLLSEHVSGTIGSNPFNFQNFNVNYLALRVNGELIPRQAYQPNFGPTEDYIREYLQVLSALDLDGECSSSLCLTPNQWANGFTFFAFKLFNNHASIRPSGSVRLDIRFGTNTAGIITILLFAESEGSIEIDKYKNVIISNN